MARRFINGRRHDAGNEYEDLVAAIDAELAGRGEAIKRHALTAR